MNVLDPSWRMAYSSAHTFMYCNAKWAVRGMMASGKWRIEFGRYGNGFLDIEFQADNLDGARTMALDLMAALEQT